MNLRIVYGLNNNIVYIRKFGQWRSEYGHSAGWVENSIKRNPDWWMTLYEGEVPTEERLGLG